MTFFETLSDLMKKSEIKPAQLSKKLNFGKNQIKYWQDNGNIPNGEILISLADFFGCSVDYLLGRTNETKQQIEVLPVSKTSDLDEQQKELLSNYNALNESGQKELVRYSGFMLENPNNLKADSEDNKNVS